MFDCSDWLLHFEFEIHPSLIFKGSLILIEDGFSFQEAIESEDLEQNEFDFQDWSILTFEFKLDPDF